MQTVQEIIDEINRKDESEDEKDDLDLDEDDY